MKLSNSKLLVLVIMMTVAMSLAGCRTSPIYNVADAPVDAGPEVDYSLSDVKQSIYSAGTGLGWLMKEVEPGHIVATLALRSHIAKVDIKYDKKSYSITYKDSENLNYNGKSIHSNYNGWVQNLNRSIQAQLTNL